MPFFYLGRIGFWDIIEGGKLENPEKKSLEPGENQRQTQPTCDTRPESNPGHIGGRWTFSSLNHPCSVLYHLLLWNALFLLCISTSQGGAVASWLVHSTPERAVRVRTLAGDIVLCSWARHVTLTVPLFTQVYKWVPANCWANLINCGKVTCDGLASRPGEVEILLAASCYRNRDKHRQLWASLGSKASLFY